MTHAPLRIVRTDCEIECPLIDASLKNLGADLILLPETASEEDLGDAVAQADLLLMCYTPVTARVIGRATRLRGIVKYGVGIDAIDIDAARARGIPVVNIPEYAEETVAEGAFSLMLALAKQLRPVHEAMQAQGWIWPGMRWLGSDIAGKTVGIVGTGRIGRAFARMAGAGFRARVIGYDPHVDAADMARSGIARHDDLLAMLGECDFVSVHCVLNGETRGMIGARELAAMKPSAFLINVSRGALIDEMALLNALKRGQIAGAALDVFSDEPLDRHSHALRELYDMENVLLSPHLTFFTREAMQRLETETLERCMELLEGGPVLVKSSDPRLRAQTRGVTFAAVPPQSDSGTGHGGNAGFVGRSG